MKDLAGRTVLEQIEELSSAEDFFLYFLLPYEPQVLNVCRLHIMKRMGQYMRQTDFEGLADDDVFLQVRLALRQAYIDFLESTPLDEKVFKVFLDQERARLANFVGLDSLTLAAE